VQKFLAAMVVLAMVSGCATMQSFFCKPTADQQTQAKTYLTAAQAEMATLQTVGRGDERKELLASARASCSRELGGRSAEIRKDDNGSERG
jgi:uncharacterized protein YceK